MKGITKNSCIMWISLHSYCA